MYLTFLAQLWKYDQRVKKLRNRIGNWKYETKEDYLRWKESSVAFNGYFTLRNEFERFLTGEPQRLWEAVASTTGTAISNEVRNYSSESLLLRI